jgi:glucose-6-phosphate isomerase
MLVGLFERAVGFYASLVNVNAYHQPGVEAGKKAATDFLKQLAQVRGVLSGNGVSAEEVAAQLGIDARSAYVRLQAFAFGNGQPLRDVARDVVGQRLRFNPDHDPSAGT